MQLAFDPSRLELAQILETFWAAHDPTSALRQGADVGAQYEPAIFYHSAAQLEVAEASRRKRQASSAVPIVTRLRPATAFWEAGLEHQRHDQRLR